MPIKPIDKCDNCRKGIGISKGSYPKKSDILLGNKLEVVVNNQLNAKSNDNFSCRRLPHVLDRKKPDIEISLPALHTVIARLEVKHILTPFVKIKERRPEADLVCWETLDVNTKKIRNYIELYETEGIPIHVLWLVERVCLGSRYFYQDIRVLKKILGNYGIKRQYTRPLVPTDYDDQGKLIGDPVNYHFSVNELIPFDVDEYSDWLRHLSTIEYQKARIEHWNYDDSERIFTDEEAPPKYSK